MPRKPQADQRATQRARAAEAAAEDRRLRELLYDKLVAYADALGPEELARRLEYDIMDRSSRVEWLGGPPTEEERARLLAGVRSLFADS